MSQKNKRVHKNIHQWLRDPKVLGASFVLLFASLGTTYLLNSFATDTSGISCQAANTSLTRVQDHGIAMLAGDDFKAENADRTTSPKPYALRYNQNQNYARFQTCVGDDYYNTDNRQRSELKENPLPARAYKDPFWVSFRVKVTGEPVSGGWTIIHQIHQNRPTGTSVERPPALSFSYGQGLSINLRCGDDSGNVTSKPILPQPSPYTPANGQEFAITYRAKIGQTDGEFAAWINGKEISNQKNICFGYPYGGSETIAKVKFGIYRSGANSQLVAEYWDMKISPNGQAPSSSSPTSGSAGQTPPSPSSSGTSSSGAGSGSATGSQKATPGSTSTSGTPEPSSNEEGLGVGLDEAVSEHGTLEPAVRVSQPAGSDPRAYIAAGIVALVVALALGLVDRFYRRRRRKAGIKRNIIR